MSRTTIEYSMLPQNWVISRISEFSDTICGGTPSRKHSEYFNGNIPWLKSGELNDGIIRKSEEYITVTGLNNSNAKLIEKGALLIALYGATTGKLGILGIKATFNQAICAILPLGNIKNKYLYWFLYKNRNSLLRARIGGAQPNISKTVVNKLSIPLPPLPEQHRIVAKIEQLFAKLDAGVEALKKAKALLKQYRQSVLKAAMEGKLTAKWREANKDKLEPASVLLEHIKKERRKKWEAEQLAKFKAKGKMPKNDNWKKKYKEPAPVDVSNLPELPEGWEWARLDNIAYINPKFNNTDIPNNLKVSFIPMKNVEALSNKIDLSISKNYSDVKKGYTPFANNDLLLAKITPCMENGKFAIAKDLKNGIGFGSTEFHVIRSADYIPINYLFYYTIRDDFRKDAQRNMKGTAGQLRVPVNYLSNILIPLPSLQEQKIIIKKIERYISFINNLESIIDKNLASSNIIRQSILKQAFQGKLVSQDPNDEPAEKLLERIKAEKAKLEQTKKPAKRKTAKKPARPARYRRTQAGRK